MPRNAHEIRTMLMVIVASRIEPLIAWVFSMPRKKRPPNAVVLSMPSKLRIRQCSITTRRLAISAGPVNGTITAKATHQRQKLSAIGGTSGVAARPTTTVPAQHSAVSMHRP